MGWNNDDRPHLRVRLPQRDQFREVLREAIDEDFDPRLIRGRRARRGALSQGSVHAAARDAEIPYATLYRLLEGQEGVEVSTLRRLWDWYPFRWRWCARGGTSQSLLFSPEDRERLANYERVIEAEFEAHRSAYGLAEDDGLVLVLPGQAQEQIERFRGWAYAKGHHAARVQLAEWRITAPFLLGEFADGMEPGVSDLTKHDIVAIVSAGIKRERLLLRRVRAPLVPAIPVSSGRKRAERIKRKIRPRRSRSSSR